jgi:hypothetical protein
MLRYAQSSRVNVLPMYASARRFFARLASEIFLTSLQSRFKPPAIEVAWKFAEQNLPFPSFSKRGLKDFEKKPPLKKGDRGGFEFASLRPLALSIVEGFRTHSQSNHIPQFRHP